TYVSFPAMGVRRKLLTSGTSTLANAGFGLLTVRAHSHATTMSFCPTYGLRSERPFAIPGVTSIGGEGFANSPPAPLRPHIPLGAYFPIHFPLFFTPPATPCPPFP